MRRLLRTCKFILVSFTLTILIGFSLMVVSISVLIASVVEVVPSVVILSSLVLIGLHHL